MNKLKKLNEYLGNMEKRLKDAKNTPEKLDWIKLEIRRTKLDIDRLTLGDK